MDKAETIAVTPDLELSPKAVVRDPLSSTTLPPLSPKAEDILYEIGFEIDDDLTEVSLSDVVAVPGGGPNIVKEIFDRRQKLLDNQVVTSYTQEEELKIRTALLKNLRVRAQNILLNLDPPTVADFVKIPWAEIHTTRSCGRETFDQIVAMQNRVRELLLSHPNMPVEMLIQGIEDY